MQNELKKGKDCIGQSVVDCDNNTGVIIDFFVENGKKSKVVIQYPDGTEQTREKYAVQKGAFRKPYLDDIDNNILTDEWRYIPGFNNRYIINRKGEIKSTVGQYKGKLLSPSQSGNYMIIGLQAGDTRDTRKLCRLHRLVAETFIRNLEEGEEVDHIDGNGLNNSVSNLRIVSRKINNQKFLDLSYMGFTANEQNLLYQIAAEQNSNIIDVITKIVKEKLCDYGIRS